MLRIERHHAPERRHPVSFTQEGFFALGGFPTSGVFRLTGPLVPDVLERALQEVLRRHEVLRWRFVATAEGVVGEVRDDATLTLECIDLRHLPAAARLDAARARIAEARRVPFDYGRPPLLRCTLHRLEDELHLALIVIDHIVFDGWSLGVLLHELATLYNAFLQGRPSPLPPLAVQYGDFARWQRARLDGGRLDILWRYWDRQLAGNRPTLPVPGDRPRAEAQPFTLATLAFEVPAGATAALRAYARQAGLSLFMTLMTGLQACLARWSGVDDVSVVVPTANRMPAETERLIGPVINLMVIRVDVGGDPSFAELGRRVRRACLSAYAHQEMPFEVVLARLGQDGRYSTMLTLENYPVPAVALRRLAMEEVDVDAGAGPYDLSFLFFDSRPALRAQLAYNAELFDPATARRYADRLLACLAAGIAAPGRRVSALVDAPDGGRVRRDG